MLPPGAHREDVDVLAVTLHRPHLERVLVVGRVVPPQIGAVEIVSVVGVGQACETGCENAVGAPVIPALHAHEGHQLSTGLREGDPIVGDDGELSGPSDHSSVGVVHQFRCATVSRHLGGAVEDDSLGRTGIGGRSEHHWGPVVVSAFRPWSTERVAHQIADRAVFENIRDAEIRSRDPPVGRGVHVGTG